MQTVANWLQQIATISILLVSTDTDGGGYEWYMYICTRYVLNLVSTMSCLCTLVHVYCSMCVYTHLYTHIHVLKCTNSSWRLLNLVRTSYSCTCTTRSCRRRCRCLPRRVLRMRCTPHTQIMLIVAICCNQFATVCNRLKLFATD